jgi:hypothetical protein
MSIPSGIGARQCLRVFLSGQRAYIPLSNSFLAQLRVDTQRAIALSRPVPGEHLSVTTIALIALTLKFNDDVSDQFVGKTGSQQFLPKFDSTVLSPGEISKTGRLNRLPRFLLLGQMSSSISSTILCPPDRAEEAPRVFSRIRDSRASATSGWSLRNVFTLSFPWPTRSPS